jgi:hypothetical protein
MLHNERAPDGTTRPRPLEARVDGGDPHDIVSRGGYGVCAECSIDPEAPGVRLGCAHAVDHAGRVAPLAAVPPGDDTCPTCGQPWPWLARKRVDASSAVGGLRARLSWLSALVGRVCAAVGVWP